MERIKSCQAFTSLKKAWSTELIPLRSKGLRRTSYVQELIILSGDINRALERLKDSVLGQRRGHAGDGVNFPA